MYFFIILFSILFNILVLLFCFVSMNALRERRYITYCSYIIAYVAKTDTHHDVHMSHNSMYDACSCSADL